MIVFPGVFFDVMGAVYFPTSETEAFGSTFTILGRAMPYWIGAGLFGYGVFAATTFFMLQAPIDSRLARLAALLGDGVFRDVLLQFDLYHYFGKQPLVLG
ncbi:hypothetical protein [Rhodococcus jostii]|uniref:hypothetical protein n=1 Tax=Rhodococcus jostii TaxID=132919 RepID=UPI00366105D4